MQGSKLQSMCHCLALRYVLRFTGLLIGKLGRLSSRALQISTKAFFIIFPIIVVFINGLKKVYCFIEIKLIYFFEYLQRFINLFYFKGLTLKSRAFKVFF